VVFTGQVVTSTAPPVVDWGTKQHTESRVSDWLYTPACTS